MTRMVLVGGLISWALVVAGGTEGEQLTGTITGRISVTTPPEAEMVSVTTDQIVCGQEVEERSTVVDREGGVSNAVLIVKGLPWGDLTPPNPVINNSGCYFVPRVQVAKTRAELEVRSEDDTLHTTHAYDDRQRTLFNIALPIPGISIKRPLRRPGVVRIECDSHGWMRGWVYVSDEVGTVTATDGLFEFPAIPPGTYELIVWHERYEGSSQQVTVTSGGMSEVNFRLQQ